MDWLEIGEDTLRDGAGEGWEEKLYIASSTWTTMSERMGPGCGHESSTLAPRCCVQTLKHVRDYVMHDVTCD